MQLGAHFHAPVAPEFARGYLQRRGGRYTEASLPIMAAGQLEAERQAKRQQGSAAMVVADTDIQVLEVWWWVRYAKPSWHRRYALSAPPKRLYPAWLQQALRQRSPRSYLLTKPDLPWEPDSLRESKGKRQQLFDHYRRVLQRDGAHYRVVEGQGSARLSHALKGLVQLGLPQQPD